MRLAVAGREAAPMEPGVEVEPQGAAVVAVVQQAGEQAARARLAVAAREAAPAGAVEQDLGDVAPVEQAAVAEPSAEAVARAAARAGEEPGAAAAAVVLRPGERALATVFHNTRKICFPMGMIYGTSGT